MSLALDRGEETSPAQDCRSCIRKSDWDFLRDFFRHEEAARQQVRELQLQVGQMGNALHQAGLNSQNDRLALNATRQQLQKSADARGRVETILQAERQEHRLCQEAFSHEQTHHQETEKNLGWFWNANARLGQILNEIRCEDARKGAAKEPRTYDISELVHEAEIKTIRIEELEKSLKDQEQGHLGQIQMWETRLQEQWARINELQMKLRNQGEFRVPGKRYRRGGAAWRVQHDDAPNLKPSSDPGAVGLSDAENKYIGPVVLSKRGRP